MIWLVGAVAVFFGLAWVGRQVRQGKLKSGPWIKQFPAIRGVIGSVVFLSGVAMLLKSQWIFGAIFVLAGLALLETARRRQRPADGAIVYSQAEIEAYRTLGLGIGAGRSAINDAWKRLMRENHPDQGGDPARAKAINAARDVLVRRASRS